MPWGFLTDVYDCLAICKTVRGRESENIASKIYSPRHVLSLSMNFLQIIIATTTIPVSFYQL